VSEIPPPVSARPRPPLWEIDEYTFQDLTVDLLAREPDLRNARLHGPRGYKQFGVDATAEIRSGGKLAASCKRYKDVSVDLIRTACKEFDEHKQRWKKEDVRHFVVVVAGYAEDPKVQQEEVKQKARYRRRNIAFELWDGTVIVQRIRKHPDLVYQYLRGDTWLSILCGQHYSAPAYLAPGTREAEASRLREFLADSTRREIDSLRGALRRGQRSPVREKLAVLRTERSLWAELTPEIQASALRLQASLALDAGQVDEAESLVGEAALLCPTDSVIGLQTRIRLEKLGPEEALDALPSADDDIETLCARGSLLLVLARTDEAVLVLEAARERKPSDVNVIRLLAILSVMRNDVARALALVEELMKLARDWEIVRWTRAVVYYLSALSSARLQNPTSAMPDPIEWAFVRRDDESARRLAEAADVFRGMAEDLDRPTADRQALEIWWLACLANLPQEQATAAQACAKLISKHPCNIYAAPWAIARGYSVDFARAAAIADKCIEATPTDLRPVLIVLACKVRTDDHAAAKEMLVKHRTRFESQGQLDTWNHWWAALLLFSGDATGALEFAKAASHGRFQRIEVAALLQQARKSHDSATAKERLIEFYEGTGDARYLMLWAEQQAFDGNWTAITERAGELLRTIPTPDALYLVLMADFETRAYDQCLSRMQKYRELFAASQLPLDVKRLRVGCLERSGKPRDALREADELRREDGSTSTLVSFTRLCVGYGDIQTAIGAASELVERSDLQTEDSISIAELLSAHAPQLSRRLLRAANAGNIPEERIFTALNLGQRLAIDREQAELRKRVEDLVGQEGSKISVLKEEDVLLLRTRTQQACREILGMYEKGRMPVHSAIDRCGFNVAPFLAAAQPSEPFRPFEQPRFFVLHGKRTGDPPVSVPSTANRLNLDITTVFLIHRLNLWGPIEQAFPEVRCSRLIVPLLNQMLGSMMSTQPEIEDAVVEVRDFVRDGRVNVNTREADGKDDEMTSGQIGAHSIHELRSRGLITEAAFAKAIESLPSSDSEPGECLPDVGSRVRCSRDDLVRLAASGVLGVFAENFQIFVSKEVAASLEANTHSIKERHTRSESIKQLIEELGERFKTGKLQTFPEAAEGAGIGMLAGNAFAELVGFPADSGDLICADDRFINGFDHRSGEEGVLIISLLDLLAVLADRRIIDRPRIWQSRHALRAANCLFLPFEPEEIAHHLVSAATRDGRVIETPELRVMRQYMGACFVQGSCLQRVSPPAGQVGEIRLAIGMRKAVVEALALLLGNRNQSGEARTARANWLIESLYVDYPGIRRALGIDTLPEIERDLVAGAAATLMMLNIEFGDLDEAATGTHYDSNAWIWNSLFRRRCNADPSLLDAVAKCIALHLSEISRRSGFGNSEDRGLLTAAVLRIIAKLPRPLGPRVQEEFTELHGFEEGMCRVFRVEDLEFEAAPFMRQVALALTGGSVKAQARRTKEEVVIRRLRSGDLDAIDLERPAPRKVHRLRNNLWGVLVESRLEREAALQRHSRLFDVTPEEFEQLLRSLGSANDPFDRFEMAAAAARCSLPFFYDGLEQRVQLNEPLKEADLMPDTGTVFFTYFGDNGGATHDAAALMAKGSTELQSRVGPVQAAVRLAALPVALPATIEAAFKNSAPGQQKEFLHALLRAGPSPIYRIHTLRLAFVASATPTLERLRHWLIRRYLGSTAREERGAFLSVLEWVTDAFDNWHAARRWDRSFRLMFSWVHANHLFAMYHRAHAPLDWIAEVFHKPRGYQAITDLEEEFVHGRDAAAAESATAERIAVSGMAYALSLGNLPLPSEIASEAKRQWITDSGEPLAWFLEMPGNRPNALGSFLACDQMENLLSLLGEDLVGDYGTTWRSRMQEQAMIEITREGPQRSTGWIFLTALYGDGAAPDEVASQIEGALRVLDFSEVVETDPNQELFLAAIASRIAHVTGEETRAAITHSLIHLAEWYGSHGGNEADASRLLNLVLAHGYPAAGRSSTIAEFQQLCLNVAEMFPTFAGPCRYTINRFCHDLPVEKSTDYWPLAFALRAMDRES
jgi:hypothetical protein